jgi:mercuric ion transport protein
MHRTLLIAGTITAVAASACCLVPLILLALGIGGAWLSFLSILEPYRPLFIGATLLLLSFAFYRIYFTACSPLSSCTHPNGAKRRRVAFWIVAALTLGLIALPWLVPLFWNHV